MVVVANFSTGERVREQWRGREGGEVGTVRWEGAYCRYSIVGIVV